MDKPTLHGTPLSHFTRKIRILLAELCVDFDFVRASSVLAISQASYADNPLMRVPTLVHAGTTVIDSEHIARYLVATYDPKETSAVRPSVASTAPAISLAEAAAAGWKPA